LNSDFQRNMKLNERLSRNRLTLITLDLPVFKPINRRLWSCYEMTISANVIVVVEKRIMLFCSYRIT